MKKAISILFVALSCVLSFAQWEDGSVIGPRDYSGWVSAPTSSGIIRAGLIGLWDFSEGSGDVVYNRANPSLTLFNQNNLIGYGEVYSLPNSGQVGTGLQPNPYGESSAMWMNATSGASCYTLTSVTTAAATYVLSIYARAAGGTNESFRMQIGGNVSSAFTLTTNWERFYYSAACSAGSTSLRPWATIGATNCNAHIWGWKFELGTTPTDYPNYYFDQVSAGFPGTVIKPLWENGTLRYTNNSGSYGLKSSPVSLTNATVYAVVRRQAAPYASTVMPIIQDDNSVNKLQLWLDNSWALCGFNFGTLRTANDMFDNSDNQYHIIAGTCDGMIGSYYLDGVYTASNGVASPVTPFNVQLLSIGARGATWYFPGNIAYVSIYNTSHSSNQVVQNTAQIKSILSSTKGITIPDPWCQIAFEGDSITYAVNNFATMTATNFAVYPALRKFAVSGSVLAGAISRAGLVDSWYVPGKTNILCLLLGANDLAGASSLNDATNFVAGLKSYCLARRAVGYKVVASTVLARQGAYFPTARAMANDLIRADSSWYNALADYASDATMGPDAVCANSTYYNSDQIHPKTAGHALLYPYAWSAIQTVLSQ